jgi:hypothetical protein
MMQRIIVFGTAEEQVCRSGYGKTLHWIFASSHGSVSQWETEEKNVII